MQNLLLHVRLERLRKPDTPLGIRFGEADDRAFPKHCVRNAGVEAENKKISDVPPWTWWPR